MQIRSTAWTLVQLLSLVAEEAFPTEIVVPWCNKQPLTGGLVAHSSCAWKLVYAKRH